MPICRPNNRPRNVDRRKMGAQTRHHSKPNRSEMKRNTHKTFYSPLTSAKHDVTANGIFYIMRGLAIVLFVCFSLDIFVLFLFLNCKLQHRKMTCPGTICSWLACLIVCECDFIVDARMVVTLFHSQISSKMTNLSIISHAVRCV